MLLLFSDISGTATVQKLQKSVM